MIVMSWGLLGPEKLDGTRRTRTLGLGAAVRAFNDLAVPGLGGVWFGKQLFLAVLGVAVAERVRNSGGQATNIATANAVEALACWLALDSNGWQSDSRLRGASKMQGKEDLAFAKVSQRSFYVTQPMRMRTVQPMLALGLVTSNSQRFSGFSCSEQGYVFIEEACSKSNPCYYSKSVLDHLVDWANKKTVNVKLEKLRPALSPLEPLPTRAREILRERLVQGSGDASRRCAALAWVENLRKSQPDFIVWDSKPDNLTDEHWKDIRAGAKFFLVREAAIALLDQTESQMANQSEPLLPLDSELSKALVQAIQSLQQRCQAFLDENHDPTQLASEFCRECVNANTPAIVLKRLVKRDDRVLRLQGRQVVPGPAYRGASIPQPDDEPADPEEKSPKPADQYEIPWPEGISERIKNLYWLNLDLHGELSETGTSDEVNP